MAIIVAIGPISDPKLTPGVWRELTKQEVKMLETMKEPRPAKVVKPRRASKSPQSRKKTASKKSSSKARPARSRATRTR